MGFEQYLNDPTSPIIISNLGKLKDKKKKKKADSFAWLNLARVQINYKKKIYMTRVNFNIISFFGEVVPNNRNTDGRKTDGWELRKGLVSLTSKLVCGQNWSKLSWVWAPHSQIPTSLISVFGITLQSTPVLFFFGNPKLATQSHFLLVPTISPFILSSLHPISTLFFFSLFFSF